MLFLAKLFDWKDALVNVKPDTFIAWHDKAFRLFWRWKSRGGRPRLPRNIRKLIAEMATNNATWGQKRVADELSIKLGILVSPRTVAAYWPDGLESGPRVSTQRWSTFVRNHAGALIACDFATVVTARFRTLYVLVLIEVGTRKILHYNVTAHPTSEWTAQQLREAVPSDHSYRFLIHDRDSIFAREVDETIANLGLKVVRTPVRSPQANAHCERLIGTVRRECLDFIIPLNEKHLRTILREWVAHYNGRVPDDDDAMINACTTEQQALDHELDVYEGRLAEYNNLREAALVGARLVRERANIDLQIDELTKAATHRRSGPSASTLVQA